ncbi:MAG: 1-deoxy-D-xylulose-5-phosphate synthase N-terminal domain-containing protein [Thalassobaculum sp.]
MAAARDLLGDDFDVVAVIGDGAMSAGHGLRSDEQCRCDRPAECW